MLELKQSELEYFLRLQKAKIAAEQSGFLSTSQSLDALIEAMLNNRYSQSKGGNLQSEILLTEC